MRDILDAAIGAPPTSTVDIDRVVAAGRRRTRLRRLAMISPAVPAVAAVAVVLATLGGSPTAPTDPIQAQPGTEASGTPGVAPVYDETPEQTRQRLATALADGLAAALPGVELTNWPTGQAGVVLSVSDDLGRYESSTVLTTAAGKGQLSFVSWRGGRTPEFEMPTPLPAGAPRPIMWFDACSQVPAHDAFTSEGYRVVTECEESVGAEGQTIVVTSERCVDCPGQPAIMRRDAYVTWTNAKVLVAIVNALKSDEPGTTPLAELLLTKEQLVTIASDPELTVAG
ncbi:MAG: hypothetical protein IRY85_06640 [Micromonosporaceae bacterium]|nr:hypothetical protein [Micromonosporaceae bacterium]